MFRFLSVIALIANGANAESEMRKYPSPAYIGHLNKFPKSMGVPMPDGKWWGHRREKTVGKKYIDSRVFNMTLRTIDEFTGTDGKGFYAFEGKGFDQPHPKSNPKLRDNSNYKMNIFNGRLYEDFTWEMDLDILSPEQKTRKYTYFGTFFTKDNYHRRLRNRPSLPMTKPNNGWVLQGCITCRGCSVCYVYSGVSMFPDQLSSAELANQAQSQVDKIFAQEVLPSKEELKQKAEEDISLMGRSHTGEKLKIKNPATRVNQVIRRLKHLYENIVSETKFGENNFGKLRKRYQSNKSTGTVLQGVDKPKELYSHTLLLIKEKFSKMGTQGKHLEARLQKLFTLLCNSHDSYCVQDE